MKILAFSHTYGNHQHLTGPIQDLLQKHGPVEAIVFAGNGSQSQDCFLGKRGWEEFLGWIGQLPVPHKLVVPGGWDGYEECFDSKVGQDRGVHVLNHSEITINGYRFFGSPLTSASPKWAFYVKPSHFRDFFERIEGPIDVLITHSCPFPSVHPHEILDTNALFDHPYDPFLLQSVQKLAPKHHIFGTFWDHLEDNYPQKIGPTQFHSVGVLDFAFDFAHFGTVIEL